MLIRKLLTVAQFAEIKQIQRQNVYANIHRGRIVAEKVGAKKMIDLEHPINKNFKPNGKKGKRPSKVNDLKRLKCGSWQRLKLDQYNQKIKQQDNKE